LVVQKIVHYRNCDWEPEGTDVRVRDERVSVHFAVGSVQYVVDECEKHAGQAMKILTELTAIASREDGKVQRRASGAASANGRVRTASYRAQTQEVRRWAQREYPERNVSDRGRIPLDLQREYDKAHR
jgi:hypothetical protein